MTNLHRTNQLVARAGKRGNQRSCAATLLCTSLLLYEPYANESSQICHFLAVRPQFESVHHQNRRLSSHSYSHESVIFSSFWDKYFLSYGEFAFFEFNCTRLCAAVDNVRSTAAQLIILRWGTAGCSQRRASRGVHYIL